MRVNKAEMLRYLGHRGQQIDDSLNAEIDKAIAECENLAAPRVLYRTFDIYYTDAEILFTGTTLTLTGNDIRAHLQGATGAVLMAATLGAGIDSAIARYSKTDVSYSLLLDCAATSLIEAVCDDTEAKIRADLEREKLGLTTRFSPGYGDLPIAYQPAILNVLQCRNIGLTCTPSLLLLPRKSVTAIMGAGANISYKKSAKCESCSHFESCNYKVCEK